MTEIVVSALKHISVMVKWRLRRKPAAAQATRKRRREPQRKREDLGVRAPKDHPDLLTCPACSRSFSPIVKAES